MSVHALRTLATRTTLAARIRLHVAAVPMARRHLSSTRPARASEDENSFISQLHKLPFFRQIADKPEALKAIADMAAVLQAKGVNMAERPSITMLWKLASDPELVAAAKKSSEELEKAGVKMDASTMFSLLKDMPKK
ncbi:hypothetical protein BKA62DRAFT_685709 [Auriculariales sp. MPI-PUGE-AT-0066]|nr:hypothetical protein BKA62DRAFT_685709 [Auriculariales sp. MPI-PUGE-AT-0066]